MKSFCARSPRLRVAGALHSRALRLTSRGEYAKAELLFRRAIALAGGNRSRSGSPLLRAALLNDFGVLSKYEGRFARAKQLYQRAASLIPRGDSQRAEFRATLYHNLAGLEHARGHCAQALRYARRGLQLRKEQRPPDLIAITADEAALAPILIGLKRIREAEAILHRALRTYRRAFGERHYETAAALANLGALYSTTGRARAAERALRQSLDALESALGANHPRLRSVLNNLAVVCAHGGKVEQAHAYYGRLLRSLRRQHGPTYPSIALVPANRKTLMAVRHARQSHPQDSPRRARRAPVR